MIRHQHKVTGGEGGTQSEIARVHQHPLKEHPPPGATNGVV
jgi:hypothetical protein